MSETEKEAAYAKQRKDLVARMRKLAEKMEEKAQMLYFSRRYNEALECYELAGYLKGAADIFEDLA